MSNRCACWFAFLVLLCGAVHAAEPRVDRYGDELPPGAVARLGSVRFQHGSFLTALAYSPDGKLLAASDVEGKDLVVWEIPAGRVRRLLVDGGHAYRLLFSPDGKYLASMSRSDTLQVWEVDTGKKTVSDSWRVWEDRHLAFSPDSRRLSVTVDGVVQLYDVRGGKEARNLKGYEGYAEGLAFLDAEKCLVLTADQGKVALWEVPTGKKRFSFTAGEESVIAAAFAPDRQSFAVGGTAKIVSVRDLDGKERFRFEGHTSDIRSIAYSPDGKTLVTGSNDGLRLWDLATGKQRYAVKGPGSLDFAFFAPDGKTFACGGANGFHRVRFFETASGKELQSFPSHAAPVHPVVFSPDGKRVVTGSPLRDDRTVRLWDAATGEPLREFGGQEDGPISVQFTPDGKQLVMASRSLSWWPEPFVRVWDVGSDKVVRRLEVAKPPVQYVSVSPDGKWIAAREWRQPRKEPRLPPDRALDLPDARQSFEAKGEEARSLRVWDRESGKQRFAIELEGNGECGFTPDSRFLFAAVGKVRFWNAQTGKPAPWKAKGLPWEQKNIPPADHVTFTADGDFLATSKYGSETALWDFVSERCVAKLPATSSIAFSPDGRFAALAGADISIYDLATFRKCHEFKRGAMSLAFSPDGTRLVSGGDDDNVALVWDTSELAKRYPLKADGEINAKNLETWWDDLGHPYPIPAYRAGWNLTAAGDKGVALLKTKLRPATKEDAARIPRLIRQLDADEYETREKATKELAALGLEARDVLREAVGATESAEARRRMQSLLEITVEDDTAGQVFRARRAVLVLERIGTPEAKALLQTLAKGAATRLTRDAQAALTRLGRRSALEK